MTDEQDVLDLLSRVRATLHVFDGRISGSLHVSTPAWTHVQFRSGRDETLEQTLRRALRELHRRMLEGMPETTHTATCSACATVTELRYLSSARSWLCAECRRGLRQMAEQQRRKKRRAIREQQ